MNFMNIKDNIEAVLFIASRPLSFKRLAVIVEAEEAVVREAVAELTTDYRTRSGGVTMIAHDDEVQMATASGAAATVQRFLKAETTGELTRPSLEALTIVAYRGPITRSDLERIRGVNCSIILRNLMVRGLVQEREGGNNRPSTYTVSVEFLRHLGLASIEDLPDYQSLHNAEVLDRLLAEQPQ